MAGLHVAQQDSTPMIMFLGLPGEKHEDREAFQEIETKSLFSSFVKWAAVIRSTSRIPEYVSRAYHVAKNGRPGPVVLGLPEDMLSAKGEAADAKPARLADPAPGPADTAAFKQLLAKAQRPLMIVGGPGWSKDIQKEVEEFAERFEMPVAAAFRFQDYIDNRHRCYAGHAGIGLDAKLAAAIRNADVLIVVGARLGEMTTSGYTLIEIPNPTQTLVHVHPSGNELGSVYRADLPLNATAATFVEMLATLPAPASKPWSGTTRELNEAYRASLSPIATPGSVQFAEVVRTVSDMMPEHGIVTNGAGNYAAFVHRYMQYKGYRSCLAPTSGSMGYGLPAAIAAKLADPTRTVVNFAGDGCFLMTGQEMATAAQYGLDIVTIVANNGMYGTIRAHQERQYPERVVGTTLMNPDFAAYARAFGGHGEKVERTADFKGAFERALAARKPAIIELAIDPEALTPRQTLSQIRAAGKKG
jgi:acetolactate synthase-1/2/3 large subunit